MSPVDLGAPAKFTEFRNGQDRVFDMMLNSTKRIVVVSAPTGIGKSLLGISFGLLSGGRYAYLTSTKGLQDQIVQEFGEVGVADVRGAGNYQCRDLPGYTCDVGGDGNCPRRRPEGDGCPYLEAIERARLSTGVVTSYAFWFATSPQRLGHRDLLIADEGHDAGDQLLGALRLQIRAGDAKPPSLSLDDWHGWVEWLSGVQRRLFARKENAPLNEQRKIRERIAKIERVMASPKPWVVSKPWGQGVIFEPLWPAQYADLLFQNIDRVLIMSATIKPKTMEYLGLDRREYDFITVPSPFPIARRPVYVFTKVEGASTPRLSKKSSVEDLQRWVRTIDRILDARGDRKGIVHTVSYDRAEFLRNNSRHAAKMMLHSSESTREVVERFKDAEAPAVLVSPAVHTGYDFPYDEAAYQVIAKIPFPDPSDPITAARTKEDADYPFHQAMAKIVQASGRGMRAPDDACETFIVDGHATWLLPKYKTFVPNWFNDSLRRVEEVPTPPRLVRR